jgi:hypothetical protein
LVTHICDWNSDRFVIIFFVHCDQISNRF